MLAIPLSLPASLSAQAQHPKQDRPAPQRQSAPHREAPSPPRQAYPAYRNNQRPAGTSQQPRSQPTYSRPGSPYPRGYSEGQSRTVARPHSYTRPSAPSSTYSQKQSQERAVPHPPSQIERRPQAPTSNYDGAQRREVPRPPAPEDSVHVVTPAAAAPESDSVWTSTSRSNAACRIRHGSRANAGWSRPCWSMFCSALSPFVACVGSSKVPALDRRRPDGTGSAPADAGKSAMDLTIGGSTWMRDETLDPTVVLTSVNTDLIMALPGLW